MYINWDVGFHQCSCPVVWLYRESSLCWHFIAFCLLSICFKWCTLYTMPFLSHECTVVIHVYLETCILSELYLYVDSYFEWVLDLVDISFKSIYTLRIVLTSYTDPLVRGEDTFHINCYESIVLVFFFVIPVNKPVHKQVVYYISSVWTVYAIHAPWHVLRWVFCQIIAGYMKQSQSLRSL